jgi:hypothetical protein
MFDVTKAMELYDRVTSVAMLETPSNHSFRVIETPEGSEALDALLAFVNTYRRDEYTQADKAATSRLFNELDTYGAGAKAAFLKGTLDLRPILQIVAKESEPAAAIFLVRSLFAGTGIKFGAAVVNSSEWLVFSTNFQDLIIKA